MKNEIKVRIVVDKADGSSVPLESLTMAERAELEEAMRRRLSKNFSELYTIHPELLRA